MSEQEWRVLDGTGKEHGPYSLQDLQGYYTTGNIAHETLVWTEGLAEWTPAGQIEGLLPDAPLPVVPLAEATPAPAAPAGGMNLNPQVTTTAASPKKGGKQKEGLSGLAIFTALSGICVIVLFFFPWISITRDIDGSDKVKLVTLYTQTGMETITKEYSFGDDPILEDQKEKTEKTKPVPEKKKKETKKTEEESEKSESDEPAEGEEDAPPADDENPDENQEEAKPKEVKAEKPDDQKSEADDAGQKSEEISFERSTMILMAFIAVALGTLLALIGLFKRTPMLTILGQVLFVTAAFLIGIQMALQFPIAKPVLDLQGALKDNMETRNKPLAEAYDALGDGDIETAKEIAAKSRPLTKIMIEEAITASPATLSKLRNELNQSQAQLEVPYGLSYRPSCFAAVGILALFILLVVITMSSSNKTTLITPQVGPPGNDGQQPQPGSGLKFH